MEKEKLKLMGEEIPIEDLHQMLEDKRKKSYPSLSWATEEEYLKTNNSKGLKIIKDRQTGLCRVIHYLEVETIVVPTPERILTEYGIVSLGGHNCCFAVALLLRFHGEPCERQSRKIGGSGYDRI